MGEMDTVASGVAHASTAGLVTPSLGGGGGRVEVSFPGNWGLDPACYGLSERAVMVPVLSTLSAKHADLHVASGPLVAKT